MADKVNQFEGVIDSLLNGMNTVLSTKTVVGEPTQVGDGTIIVPLVDVSFGIGAGAGSNGSKNTTSGAGGLGGKMTPSAILIIKNGTARIVNIKNQDALTKVLDMIPDLVEKFTTKKDESTLTDEEVIDIAFPEEEQ